jgi:hypothetical protein
VFARSPWYALPAHLRRFGVRAPWSLARGFSWQHRLTHFAGFGSDSRLRLDLAIRSPDLPREHPTRLPHVNHRVGWATFLRHPIARPHHTRVEWPHSPKGTWSLLATCGRRWTRPQRYRNINRSSIDYASRPRLRSRLTLGGLTFPRNPWAYGGRVFHPSFATHAGIRTRQASTTRFPCCFTRLPTLPNPPPPLHPGSSPPGQRFHH